MASDSPKQINIGKLVPPATLSCKVRSGCFIKRPPKSLKFPGFSKKLTSEEAGACISHKRLRQGAEQRALQLEERLAAQQRHTAGFDEAQSGLIQQSQLLISRNAELTHRLKTVEASVEQLQSLKLCLEAELAQVYSDRDRLAAQVHQPHVTPDVSQSQTVVSYTGKLRPWLSVATHNSVAKRARAARLAWGEIA
ncbi:uncharacterized protein HaLaN_02193 [Haematococcus lacustris]|uniref:Uncharacterized protein n=1 Tax=Haematococcus lacustris TaxID=44745 RepID=A0A699YMU1_HAELA|nr:uncharacterized protein HaLaN_02193 [Haematococcus lacustris]